VATESMGGIGVKSYSRARSAGVGVFLATQSPGDFDYKCKENVRT
jgi:hypothetical protein